AWPGVEYLEFVLDRFFDQEPPERFGNRPAQSLPVGLPKHFLHHVLDPRIVAHGRSLALDHACLLDIALPLGKQLHEFAVDPVDLPAHLRHRVAFDHWFLAMSVGCGAAWGHAALPY